MTKRALSLLLAVLFLLTAFPFSALAETDELPPEELPQAPSSAQTTLPELPEESDLQVEAPNAAATSGTCGDNLTWSFNKSTGTLTIEGCGVMYDYDYGTNPWYNLCQKITTISMTPGIIRIGKYAFINCKSLTSITIPTSVTSIGNSAFSSCTSLTSITIPDSVISIGDWAFHNCTSLTSITIPTSVTSIGRGAFSGCTSLTGIEVAEGNSKYGSQDGVLFSKDMKALIIYPEGKQGSYTIPDGVTSIGNYAFQFCDSLTSIAIPASVTSIGGGAFLSCTSLTSITIPGRVTSIGYGAFSGCTSLTSVTIGNSVTSIGEEAFLGCTSLTSITIPGSVTSIGSSAFNGCTSLTSITIPGSVTSIGEDAFQFCDSLTSIEVAEGDSEYCSQNGVLFSKDKKTIIVYPRGKQGSYTIPDGVTSIGNGAFYGCKGLTSVTSPASVTSIGEYAFLSCISLTSINIPASVTSIGEYAFRSCISLTSITIPDSVTSISYRAFENCTSLTSITIPASVTSIGEDAFSYCTSLTDVYYGGTQAQRARIIINGDNEHLLNATWHVYSGTCGENLTWTFDESTGTLTIQGSGAMRRYTSSDQPWSSSRTKIKSVSLPDGLTSIGSSAFYGCTSLTSITIPDSVTCIDGNAFYGCTSLTSITIPTSVTSIGSGAFWGCTSLTSITIPDSVTGIDNATFYGCASLTSITIPASVTSIKQVAFTGCNSLSNIYYGGTQAQRAGMTINGNNKPLLNATWHYNSTGPTPTPTATPTPTPTATPTPKPLVLPVIKTQPKSVTVNNGKAAKFSVKATGKNLKYQWEVSVDGGESWENVAKATKSSLSVKTVKAMAEAAHPYQYRCKVSNADGFVYTDAATLTVNLVPPVITGQPASISVNNTKKASFTVKAKNSKSFQWEVSEDGESWEALPKATKASYSLTADYKAMNGKQYRCKVSNADGYVYTDAVTLTVKLVPPVITGQPANISIRNGKNANLTIKAKGAKKYQWQVNDGSGWVDIPKATKAKLTLNKVTVDMNDNWYRCVAINADGEVTSEPATLTVYLVPPTVTTEPKDATVKSGKTASFSVKAKEAKTYQWQVNDGSGWVDVPKATKNKLSVKKVTADMSGNMYRCIVTNADGFVESAAARLTVNP